MNGLHIALWSESMSSPCKALGLILSTKGRWGEARRRKEKEREVCISELCLLYTFPWEAAGAEAVFRGGEIFQTHSFYTWSAGGSGHQQWDFLQESSQHIRGLGPSTSVTLGRAHLFFKGKSSLPVASPVKETYKLLCPQGAHGGLQHPTSGYILLLPMQLRRHR